jgi:D-glycero-D-manno-heptose 1,7-bisphosphate phosphatase
MGVAAVTQRAVFLDRDGVLNRAVVQDGRPHPPATPEEMEILPGVAEALRDLRAARFRLIVVTNQPDVARGRQTHAAIEAMHARLASRLPLDDIRVCYHDDSDRCRCRKPEPGLLVEAAAHAGVDLAASFLVGDRWRDIEAGRRAGCRTVLIDYGYAEPSGPPPDERVGSLQEAAEWILRQAGARADQEAR